LKQFSNRCIVAKPVESQSPTGYIVGFGQGYQWFRHPPQLFGLWQGRFDHLVMNQRGRHVAKHRISVAAIPIEMPSGFAVAHGGTSLQKIDKK
jgi:hypothetical protein